MRFLLLLTVCCSSLGWIRSASAADQKVIDAAIKGGAAYLSDRYRNIRPGAEGGGEGIGPTALAGLALLECGKPAADPTIKAITAAVRDAAYSERRTYQLALCLIYLDRLGEVSDGPRIQMLAVRLLAGQNANGGWTYSCVDDIPRGEEQRLRARIGDNQLVANEKGTGSGATGKGVPPVPVASARLHPEIEKHRQGLLANQRNRVVLRDDNSNTQFGILAVWVARRHGVPVEAALEAIEKRFLGSQAATGGWPYSGILPGEGSPSMTCAGLLGLATAVGRREERRMQAEVPKRPIPPKPAKTDPNAPPEDPFFTTPPKPEPAPKKAAAPKRPPDQRDRAVDAALDNLAAALGGGFGRRGRDFRPHLGGHDMYFLWSLERVGVVFGLNKVRGIDWYQFGADILIPLQKADGSWGSGGASIEVDTAFALLFLAKSNLVRDLSAKVQHDPRNNELRGGPSPTPDAAAAPVRAADPRPNADPIANLPTPAPRAPNGNPAKPKPLPVEDDSEKLALALLNVPATAWSKGLQEVRDGKGGDFTKALVIVIHRVDGDQKKQTRGALAERLTRMSAATLRRMIEADDAELRRGAVLACAMKDDKQFIPDLIGRITDDEETVVRAARAGLKSLSGGQDFGPDPDSEKIDRRVAAEEWKQWWSKQKK